jgi:hypothetical protein
MSVFPRYTPPPPSGLKWVGLMSVYVHVVPGPGPRHHPFPVGLLNKNLYIYIHYALTLTHSTPTLEKEALYSSETLVKLTISILYRDPELE